MIIGVPKEIKNNENRVGMTPSGVAELVKRGHTVYIQHTAGENSGFQDEAYTAVGAQILPTMEETYAMAQMIVKVKEPIAPEYRLIRKEQLLFTYFHFASDRVDSCHDRERLGLPGLRNSGKSRPFSPAADTYE